MKMKNVVIFGDSYSTFEGHIPKEYRPYYTPTRPDIPEVRRVEDTWWHMLITEQGANIVRNDSWSGSTVCNTAYYGEDCSKTNSFICRLNKLDETGYFDDKSVDTVFIFGGTNDSWAGSPIGELQYSDWTDKDLLKVLPGFCYFVDKVCRVIPGANVICLINTGMNEKITQGYVCACEHFGINYIKYESIDKEHGHPTKLGMIQIKDEIKSRFFA
ncbi:MAG: hypothetical protein E7649_07775 [Ruminococcaceae bacterium]|nr:hypothetical protein [Oscillospiraceae bacterium]